jgi:AraC-like DNA-binding protein
MRRALIRTIWTGRAGTHRHSAHATVRSVQDRPSVRSARSPGSDDLVTEVDVVETVDDARAWNAVLERSFMRFAVESHGDRGFRGSFRVRRAGGVDFVAMVTDRHVSHRSAESIATDDRADFLVCLQVDGVGEFSQGSRTATVRPGDITLFDSTIPASVASSDGYRSLCVRLPHRLVGVSRSAMSELTAIRFAPDDGLVPAFGSLLATVDRAWEVIPGTARSIAAHNAADLLTAIFLSALGRRPARRGDETELEHMLRYIDRHLIDPDLSPSMIAAAHYVSLRRAHGIFHDAGLTISGEILRRRLERCRADLMGATEAQAPVASIGIRWGFRTATQFGRAFRNAFGEPPASYRSHARGDER